MTSGDQEATESVPSATPRSGSLAKAVCSVAAVTVCAKGFGFLEKLIVARHYGTTGSADVYFAVMGILWSLVFIVKELLYPSLLPVFTETLSRDPDAAGGLFRRVFAITLASVAVVVVGGMVFAPQVIGLLLPGFDGQWRSMASRLLRAVGPAALCMSVLMVTYTVLNARRQFAVSAWGEALFKGLVAAGLLAAVPLWGMPAVGVVLAVAGVGAITLHLAKLPERRFLIRGPGPGASGPELKRVGVLVRPLLLGVAFSHVSGLFDNLLASELPRGELSYLSYAKRFVDAVLLVGPVALVTVVYSQAARLRAAGQTDRQSQLLARSARIILCLAVPMSLLLIETRLSLVQVVFGRGRFDAASVLGTSRALGIYAAGLVTLATESLLVYSFYAASNTRTPVVVGIVFVIVDIVLAALLVRCWGGGGIAAAFVFSKTAKVAVLAYLLRKGLFGGGASEWRRFILKLAVVSIAMWCGVRAAGWMLSALALPGGNVAALFASGAAGAIVFIGGSVLVRLDEVCTAGRTASRMLGAAIRRRG